jgi:DNA-binding transcriptional ArsR family regulator
MDDKEIIEKNVLNCIGNGEVALETLFSSLPHKKTEILHALLSMTRRQIIEKTAEGKNDVSVVGNVVNDINDLIRMPFSRKKEEKIEQTEKKLIDVSDLSEEEERVLRLAEKEESITLRFLVAHGISYWRSRNAVMKLVDAGYLRLKNDNGIKQGSTGYYQLSPGYVMPEQDVVQEQGEDSVVDEISQAVIRRIVEHLKS